MGVKFQRAQNNASNDDKDSEENYENEKFSVSFFNQRLKGHYLILTANSVYAFMMFFAFLFIGISFIIASENKKVVLIRIQYDNSSSSFIDFTIDKDIPKPVYFYYELWNSNRNHRLRNNGFCVKQLVTGSADVCDYRDGRYQNKHYLCENETKISNVDSFIGEKSCGGNQSRFYAPIGSVAATIFNDTFELFYDESQKIHWNEDDLVDENSRLFFAAPQNDTNMCEDKMFKGTAKPQNWKHHICEMGGYRNTSFVIWMQMAAYRNIKKLYRKLDEVRHDKLRAGNYRLYFENNYRMYNMKKFFWIMHPSFFGNEMTFLELMYGAVGFALLTITIFSFIIRSYTKRRSEKYHENDDCDCCKY